MIPRIKVGKGVTGAVRYVLSEGKDRTGKYRTEPQGNAPRVAWLAGLNLGFAIETAADADLARRIMEFDALNQTSRTKRCEKDCVHISLGWRKGEQPTREQMIEAARTALASLGMANAKAIIAAHTDEPYAHLHIVASKINPNTGRAYDLKGDRLKLSAWAQEYEQEHGGIIVGRRVEANRLRAAIEARDAASVLTLLTQQRATFKPADLERALAKQIKQPLERAQFGNAVLAQAEVVRLAEQAGGPATRYTTRTILQAEGQVMLAARALNRNRRHGVSQEICRSIIRRPEFRTMSDEQLMAFVRATDAGGLFLIDGQAGTGKSHTMTAIRLAYEAAGYRVIGLAPSNAVAEDMRASGFAHADTIHAELFKLNNRRASPWGGKTLLLVDEAAMIDTALMAQLLRRAEEAGAKVGGFGDDRQLSSIDRGGMFGALVDEFGAASLTIVRRQHKPDDRRASEMMAEGNFADALAIYQDKGAIHWQHNTEAARAALVEQWAKDSAANPSWSRFILAYTNEDVDRLNADIRQIRIERGELGPGQQFDTKHGPTEFAQGDRIQFTGTDKRAGLHNGAAGTVTGIDGNLITVDLDGRGSTVTLDADQCKDFRHGYAGTIYKSQGRTLDQTYLYHSAHWKASAGYVALTRHRESTAIFASYDEVENLAQLARQMGRVDDRRAASRFFQLDGALEIERTPTAELPKISIGPREAAPSAGPMPTPAQPVAESTNTPAAERRPEPGPVLAFTPASEAARTAEAVPYVPVHPTLPRPTPSAPGAAQEAAGATPTPAPAPERQGPRDWAQSPGMVAQQASALREAARAERAQVQAHGPMAPLPQPASKPRATAPAAAAPASPGAAPRDPAPTPAEPVRMAEVAQPGAVRPTAPAAPIQPPQAPSEAARAAEAAPWVPTLRGAAPFVPAAAQEVTRATPAPTAGRRPEPTPVQPQPVAAPINKPAEVAPHPAQAASEVARAPQAAPAAEVQPTPAVAAPVAQAMPQQARQVPTPAAQAWPEPRPAVKAAAAATTRPPAKPAAAGEVIGRPLTADEVQNRFADPALRARYDREAAQHSARQQGAQSAPAETQTGRNGSANAPAEKVAEVRAAEQKTAEQKRFEEITARFTRAGIEHANTRERSGGRGGRRR